jgi:hypothetical protein
MSVSLPKRQSTAAFSEGQRDFPEPDTELAHLRTVQHRFSVHQVHPVIEVHMIDLAVNVERQHVTPAQRVTVRLAARFADDVGGSAAIRVGIDTGDVQTRRLVLPSE